MKVLLLDIETMAELIWAWELYDTSAIEVERHGHLLCFAWKWLDEKKIHVLGQDDFRGYEPFSDNDKALCKELFSLLNEADCVIGHNARAFDCKKVNYRFIVNNIPPPSEYKIIDTKTEVKKIAKFASHKLDSIGAETKIGRKLEHEGWPLWKRCYQGNKEAWSKMKAYNKQDIKLLEDWYLKLRPWIKNHPNISNYNESSCCPTCGSRELQKRGFRFTKTQKYQQLACKKCFSWSYVSLDTKRGFKPIKN